MQKCIREEREKIDNNKLIFISFNNKYECIILGHMNADILFANRSIQEYLLQEWNIRRVPFAFGGEEKCEKVG